MAQQELTKAIQRIGDLTAHPALRRLDHHITASTTVTDGGDQRGGFTVVDIDRPKASEGTNRLIRDGAFPVFDPGDLVEELSLILDLEATKGERMCTDQVSGFGRGRR